jgi:histidyl-tRNA synthetase
MEISDKDLPGSLGGGGRYDNLVGMFAGHDVPACGFSLGLERIIVVMTERSMFPATVAAASADVLIASLGEDYLPEAIGLAQELRAAGLGVSIYPDVSSKPQKSLSYADAQRIPIAVLIGEDEHSKGIVTVRNLVQRGQERPFRQTAVAVVKAMLVDARRTQRVDE